MFITYSINEHTMPVLTAKFGLAQEQVDKHGEGAKYFVDTGIPGLLLIVGWAVFDENFDVVGDKEADMFGAEPVSLQEHLTRWGMNREKVARKSAKDLEDETSSDLS